MKEIILKPDEIEKKIERIAYQILESNLDFNKIFIAGIAKNGYHVLIHGRNQNKLNSLYDKIKSLNGTSTIINLDLKDYEGIDKLGYEIFKKYNFIR